MTKIKTVKNLLKQFLFYKTRVLSSKKTTQQKLEVNPKALRKFHRTNQKVNWTKSQKIWYQLWKNKVLKEINLIRKRVWIKKVKNRQPILLVQNQEVNQRKKV